MRRRDQIVLAASLLGIVAVAGETLWKYERRESREGMYRRQLLELGTAIKPCTTVQDTAEVFSRRPSSDLRVQGGPAGGWQVMTPQRLGAKNWILFVDVAAGRVTHLRYRTEDSASEHPADAPADVEGSSQC
jgi:hypothetical protein